MNTFYQSFDGSSLLELIKKLVTLDRHWIPKEPGHSLYIRPTLSYYVPLVQVVPLADIFAYQLATRRLLV
jgi:branched-chain amino acid aminotransferase